MSASLAAYSHRTVRPVGRGILDLRLSEVFWLIGFNALFFESPMQNVTGFSYIDEIMTVLLLGAAVAKVLGRGGAVLPDKARTAALLMVTVVCVGLLGNAVWKVQTQATPILIDLFTCVKFPIALISALVVFRGSGERLFRVVETEAKIAVVVLFTLGVANMFADFGMGTDGRYGLRAAFMGIFGHPTYLVFACVGLSVILLADLRRNLPWILMDLVVVALSLRSKGIVYVAVVLLVLVLWNRRRRRISPLLVVACGILAIAVGWDQFVFYFQSDGFARAELLRTSLQVAADFAPLGSGFATYGSNVTASSQWYSSLYYEYGLSTVYGLTPTDPSFLSDAFWPTVLGQFGWVGLTCYVGMLITLFRLTYRLTPNARLAVVCCFAYLLISSTSESAFFNPQSVYLAFCLALVVIMGMSGNVVRGEKANHGCFQ